MGGIWTGRCLNTFFAEPPGRRQNGIAKPLHLGYTCHTISHLQSNGCDIHVAIERESSRT